MRQRYSAIMMLLVVVGLLTVACDVEPTTTPSSGAQHTATIPVTTTVSITTDATTTPSAVPKNAIRAQVVRVVDGDTVVVRINGREDRLRYIGVDTPETVKRNSPVECYGKEASRANTNLVDDATVYLVKDVSDRDRYDRLLRYVYVENPDGDGLIFVNLWLVQQGYATVSTFPPDVAHVDEFRAAEREARAAQRGLWGACPAP